MSRAWARPGPERAPLARPVAALLLAVLLLTMPLLVAPGARADGDPASDVLLGTDVFYPYTTVSHAAELKLNAAAAALRRDRLPVKVALIHSPEDLGVIPEVFEHPQQYAAFLEREISFTGPPRLLVVMPAGYGTAGMPAAAVEAVAELPRPDGSSGTALTEAATAAVARIAAAEGHPLPGASTSLGGTTGGSGGGGATPVLIAVLVAVAVLTSGALVATRRRRRQPAA